jgi:uncharacterized membrane protein YjjP (DUF1212 family)
MKNILCHICNGAVVLIFAQIINQIISKLYNESSTVNFLGSLIVMSVGFYVMSKITQNSFRFFIEKKYD